MFLVHRRDVRPTGDVPTVLNGYGGFNVARTPVYLTGAAAWIEAGGLFAINFQYIAPSSVFDFRLSLSIVLMPIIGGVGTVAGPIFGALIFSTLQIKLLSIPALRDSFLFIYGGRVVLWVRADDSELDAIGPKVPSASSADHGAPPR